MPRNVPKRTRSPSLRLSINNGMFGIPSPYINRSISLSLYRRAGHGGGVYRVCYELRLLPNEICVRFGGVGKEITDPLAPEQQLQIAASPPRICVIYKAVEHPPPPVSTARL